MKTVANLQFTESGVLVERPYSENYDVFSPIKEEKFTGEFLEIAKRLAKTRMSHCYHLLHQNFAKATHITKEIIAWKGGKFQVFVWESLEKVLEITDVRELTTLQAQQLIRSILLNSNGSWVFDYDVNTWTKISGSDVRISEEFIQFITEQVLVGEPLK